MIVRVCKSQGCLKRVSDQVHLCEVHSLEMAQKLYPGYKDLDRPAINPRVEKAVDDAWERNR